MEQLRTLLENTDDSSPLLEQPSDALAEALTQATGMCVYPRSVTASQGTVFFLGVKAGAKQLGLVSRRGHPSAAGFSGDAYPIELGQALTLQLCLTSPENCAALRRALPFTAPQLMGIRRSVGFGDRLGLATPGHIRALRRQCSLSHVPNCRIAPIFAQQSIREMVRTERTPQQVMDDASLGVFQEGWRLGFGADADHLKSKEDVDLCADVGFTLYTIDPGDQVDNIPTTASARALAQKVVDLPWDVLESSPEQMRSAYLDIAFDLGDHVVLQLTEETLLRAAAKYGHAVAHTVILYRHLVDRLGQPGQDFELEVSVDETETPTTPEEHFFVARELARLGVRWVSLAPRYLGRFEKGVDYIGDLRAFEEDLILHMAVVRRMGPYKISIHSGSDKFSIYPAIARVAGDMVHLKTAGTSYLEALRALADIDASLFREILAFAIERYASDRASYHVSADPDRFPDPRQLTDDQLAGVLDSFDGRQLLHVTFGSVLTARDTHGDTLFRERLQGALACHEETHYEVLETHLGRHIAPFVG
jgi:hypothetical protein